MYFFQCLAGYYSLNIPPSVKEHMTTDTKALHDIPDGKPVNIFLPLRNQEDMVKAQCVYQKTAVPKFTLLFTAGELPVENIDSQKPCIVSVDMGGPTVSLEAMIRDVASAQKLEMIARKTISHAQLREYFRVDAETRVVTKAFKRKLEGDQKSPWAYEGQTVDISGSGVRAIFTECPPAEHPVRLEINIPGKIPATVEALAHQVRSRQLKDGSYEVAFHYDEISTEDRDKIIGCCLDIQRQMLRLRVRVKDND